MKLYAHLLLCVLTFQSQSLDAQPNTDSLLLKAKMATQSDHFMEALAAYDLCVGIDTTKRDCLFGQASSAQKVGQMLKAKVAYLKLQGDSVYQYEVWRRLARIYESEESIPKAVKYYSFLSRADTTNAYYFRKLGEQYHRAGERQGALSNYLQALKLNDKDIFTLKGLAQWHIDEKESQEADSLLTMALKLDSTSVSIKLMLARSKYQQKHFDQTVELLIPLSQREGLTNYFSKMLGYSLLRIDSVAQSIPYLQQSLVDESDPEYAEYYLGIAHEKLEDIPSAIFYYERAIGSGISKNIGLYYKLLGNIAKEENRAKDAIEYYKSAYDYSGEALVLFNLGELSADYYKDKSIALRYYRRYLKRDDKEHDLKNYTKEKINYLRQQQHMAK